jgi:GMP synthase-like glutamine amidotransferase
VYSWLCEEKQFIAEAVRRKKKVLGICLGAQLLASSLGSHVYPNTQKEIGWFPVQLTPAGRMSRFFKIFPEQFEAFHWHGDTFDLPDGTDWLVESKACKHQAFSFGRHVLGLQFHLEVEQKNIELLIDNCGNELHNASFIQSAELMLQTTHTHKDIRTYMNSLLDQFTE